MNIAYVSTYDPRDRRSWSGTIHYMAQALQKHCGDVTYIAPLRSWKEPVIARSIHRGSRFLLGKRFAYKNCVVVAKSFAKQVERRLDGHAFDLIVAPAGATIVAFLETTIPVLLIEDATYGSLVDYHQEYSHLIQRSINELHLIEKLALQKAAAIVPSSQWAADSAIMDYHMDARKVHIVPFGANLDHPPAQEMVSEKKKSERCRLLFVGSNWERKGGDIAFETLVKLEELGIQAELTVCGCTPPAAFSHESMKVIPFLDKNDPLQRQELEKLYMASDFLLLPTRNECFGIVFCEANAFGLPAITTDTGGVSGVVSNGENGYLLPYEARGDAYAEVIARIYRDDTLYSRLMKSSRAAFDERLNWDAWGIAVKNIIADMSPIEDRVDVLSGRF